jgi:tRNA (guanine-N7-)-methyltransferase
LARKKLTRFADNIYRDNILEPGKPLYETIKGHWHSDYFQNQNPLVLELGCGKGEYTSGLAQVFPDKNFVGIDVKGERIWVGSTIAIEQKLNNVAFVRTEIQFLENFFSESEIAELWIPFPDPKAKVRWEKHRMTNARYLHLYKKLLQPGGIVNFKTDNVPLFEYTLGVLGVEGFANTSELPEKAPEIEGLQFTFDLYNSDILHYHHGVQTRFEERYLQRGRKICYMRLKMKDDSL